MTFLVSKKGFAKHPTRFSELTLSLTNDRDPVPFCGSANESKLQAFSVYFFLFLDQGALEYSQTTTFLNNGMIDERRRQYDLINK